jgi:hypothetical protein
MNGVLQQMLLGKLNKRKEMGGGGGASEGHEIYTKYRSQKLETETTLEA